MKVYFIIGILFWSIGLCAQKTNQQTLERLMAKNRYYEVLKCIDSLNRVGIRTPDLLFYKGKANEGILRYKEAYHCYSDWLKLDSTNRDAQLATARIAVLAGRTMKAIDVYQKLVKEDSLDFFANYQLARLYEQNGKLTDAIQIYSRLHETDTTNAALLKKLGDCYLKMNWYLNAVGYYNDAFWLDPEDGEVVVRAVNIMLANQSLFPDFKSDAMKLVDTALVYSPRLNTLKQLRGILEYLSRRFGISENIFEELLVQGDSVRLNYKYYGLSLFRMNRFQEAITPLACADSLYCDDWGNRTDFELAMRYGEALGQCRQTQKALQVFKAIEKQMMPDTMMLSRLAVLSGQTCEFASDRNQAIKNYWRAYQLNPKNERILYMMASYHYGLWVEKDRRKDASEKEVRTALFFHILFLQNVKNSLPGEKHTIYFLSKDIIQKELEELFFRHETQVVVIDPDGKKYTYSVDEIRDLIKSETKPIAL